MSVHEETEEERNARLAAEQEDKQRRLNEKGKNERESGDDNDTNIRTGGLNQELVDNMDGLAPPFEKNDNNRNDNSNSVIGGGGRKRKIEETGDQFSKITDKFLKKEITKDQYFAYLEAMKDNDGKNKSKGGNKSRRGGRRSSIVCSFLCCFLLCCFLSAGVFLFVLVCS